MFVPGLQCRTTAASSPPECTCSSENKAKGQCNPRPIAVITSSSQVFKCAIAWSWYQKDDGLQMIFNGEFFNTEQTKNMLVCRLCYSTLVNFATNCLLCIFRLVITRPKSTCRPSDRVLRDSIKLQTPFTRLAAWQRLWRVYKSHDFGLTLLKRVFPYVSFT